MFIYLVAPVATILIIFGLLHAKRISDWLRSSARCSLTLYNGLVCRRLPAPFHASSLSNTEEVEEDDPLLGSTGSERSSVRDRTEPEDTLSHRTAFDRRKERPLNAPRYSFEDLLSEERDKDLGLTSGIGGIALGSARLGVVKDDEAVRTVKQDNIFESLRSSIDKTVPTPRLNTKQIYNMILKETLKESEARQKLLDPDKMKFNESALPVEIKEQIPSSSEKKVEREDDIDD